MRLIARTNDFTLIKSTSVGRLFVRLSVHLPGASVHCDHTVYGCFIMFLAP